ncbi:MAG TPA: glycosyltransferase family 87 protein, partial [Tepidisphaeraceae bacterium]|jgi:hypothetical protein|nr:glycosyltransferase family 87 protein [Tepidisphaeraceae bacterium]
MYDISACQRFQHALAASFGVDLGSAVGPWWNPPFYAWVFVPLAWLPYETALALWLGIDVICAAAACWVMVRMLPRGEKSAKERWKNWLLVPVLVGLSMPFLQCMTHAQNSCTSLLILAAAVAAWRGRRGAMAGAILGLLFYKPQLAAVLAIVLIVDLGWPAVAGLGMMGAGLLAINIITLPGSLTDYLHRLPGNVRFVQTQVPYMWDRHVTIKAFWRLLFQGRTAGPAYGIVTVLTVVCCAGLGGYLVKGMWGYWRSSRQIEKPPQSGGLMERAEAASRARDRLISAAIAATPLLMPFYFDYDQLLLAIPAVLLAGEWLRRPTGASVSRLDRLLLIVWPIYYCVLILNPDIGEAIHVNLAVPLLATIATLNIARLNHHADAVQFSESPVGSAPVRLAA